jgi:hypothetical protein
MKEGMMITTQIYVQRLQRIPNPSPELQEYIRRVTAYAQAGGFRMDASNEVWGEMIDRNQIAWNAVPEDEQAAVRRLSL